MGRCGRFAADDFQVRQALSALTLSSIFKRKGHTNAILTPLAQIVRAALSCAACQGEQRRAALRCAVRRSGHATCPPSRWSASGDARSTCCSDRRRCSEPCAFACSTPPAASGCSANDRNGERSSSDSVSSVKERFWQQGMPDPKLEPFAMLLNIDCHDDFLLD